MSVYLDHSATTPLRPEARDAWVRASEVVGNPSSIHGGGQGARRLLEESRERLAVVLGCDPIEVVLTSGGTEAVNLALKGLWWSRPPGRDTIVLPDGEHHATLDTVEWLRRHEQAIVAASRIDSQAHIDMDAFVLAVSAGGVALATALAANNEAGTINDTAALGQRAAAAGVALHVDAIAALGHVPLRFSALRGKAAGPAGLVALSVSAHKVGGPVGVGALVVSRAAAMTPLLHGGGQQRALRAGTQDVAGAAAFAVAAELAEAERLGEGTRVAALRDDLVRRVLGELPEVQLLGDPHDRLPGNAHLLFAGASGETLLFLLDQAGLAVSTGSACQAGVPEPSHVVLAMGRTPAEARSVLRVSLGRTSTAADVDALVRALPEAYRRARSAQAR